MAEKKNFSRRDFLKVIGAGSGVVAAGCAQELPEKIIPYVVQPDEVIPGNSVWYAGSCNECSSGCGTLIRTREGRAVKIEGNPAHPVNQGALCAIGQSALQAHYDPDRIREPQQREPQKGFEPAKWKDAVGQVAQKIAESPEGKEIVFITNRLSGSVVSLLGEIQEFSKKKITHIEWELLNRDALDLAAVAVFGEGVETHFDLSKADVLVSFGADFLETWVSPVEFSRQWASRRTPKKDLPMSYFAHFEPRLSQTGANADRYFANAPGSEAALLGALLKSVLSFGAGKSLASNERSQIEAFVAGVDVNNTVIAAGLDPKLFAALAKKLAKAKSSLVLAGGPAASENSIEAATIANLLNLTLGNVGSSVILRKTDRKPVNSYGELVSLATALIEGKRKAALVVFAGVNPVFALPKKSRFQEGIGKADFVVSITTALDETAQLANLLIPLSTNLEGWSDGEVAPGVWNLNQPSMQPLYQSQSLGDTLLAVGIAMKMPAPKNFQEYMKLQWKKRVGGENFDNRWLSFVESGGDLTGATIDSQGLSRSLSSNFKPELLLPSLQLADPRVPKLYAFPTVNMGDGRGANRAWQHEIPNSISTSVWGSWVEVHTSVAEKNGLKQGDVVQIATAQGVIEAPVMVSKYIHPSVVAVPLGQGHSSYGRFGTGVGANPLAVLPGESGLGGLRFISPLRAADAEGASSLRKVLSSEKLVTLQLGQEQGPKRGIMRAVSLSTLLASGKSHHVEDARLAESGFEDHGKSGHGDSHGKNHGSDHGGEHGAGGAHHHDPLALGPQPSPRQMYVQMDHPIYRWGMTVDLSSCTGCSACITACYAENNIAVVGKDLCSHGREMSWLRIERYMDGDENQPVLGFLPVMCQHCANAPCEPVCPVYATYHNEDGLNTMVYNRCVGTRYCANNCSYKVRRFNWFRYWWPDPLTWQLNPDVTVREVGVMEKCTFCVQRTIEAKSSAKNEGRTVRDGEVKTACQATCPTQAITFGNLLDKDSAVAHSQQDGRAYKILDQYINTQPSVSYLARVKNDTLEA